MLTNVKFAIQRDGQEVLSWEIDMNSGVSITDSPNIEIRRGVLLKAPDFRTIQHGDKVIITHTQMVMDDEFYYRG